ncbi:rhodanese-like domain-containing protein [Profundibacterium mesophilum]|uniref:Hydroxyacylglutathione hydrolase n=1 Tax=Profundibacterium mesophilum KAUST100406-0324 TaxID=1037889 RepID=A0A921TC18_9RHOB|nr:rhodanese-like domain-containing protein [Profundibacterium mesophilum]KAF0676545.1 hydroxyacylglutathione hydrolase [Profundibacterium mesophilum KAUST100406-0324]
MPITPVSTLVADAKAAITSLSAAEVRARLDAADMLLVDIRDRREIDREGRIPGAFHAPRGMLEFWVDPQSPYHKPILARPVQIVLYCASSWRSALAARDLQAMGLGNVAELEGGFTAWKATGGPIEATGTVAPEA